MQALGVSLQKAIESAGVIVGKLKAAETTVRRTLMTLGDRDAAADFYLVRLAEVESACAEAGATPRPFLTGTKNVSAVVNQRTEQALALVRRRAV